MSIYVEILMRTDNDLLWQRTQTPDQHQRWDLRFTEITYLPRPDVCLPQRFLYKTKIGFGMEIAGEGETVGSRADAAGCRTSALKFWSRDPRSLIREGSGYWKYAPTEEGVRFLTRYDYRTRFGKIGALFDRLVFRPMIGWATAWSFDRLRLWLEKGVDPGISLERSILHHLSRLTLAFLWIYQGIFPKLLFRDSGELAILQNTHLFAGFEPALLSLIGVSEIVFGGLLLWGWRARRLLVFNILALVLLAGGAAFSQPRLLVAPFNPVTLNLAMAALAFVGIYSDRDLPTARNCRRQPLEEKK